MQQIDKYIYNKSVKTSTDNHNIHYLDNMFGLSVATKNQQKHKQLHLSKYMSLNRNIACTMEII